MRINFNLAGTSRTKASIRVVVSHKGSTYRRCIGVSVKPSEWNSARQRTYSNQLVNKYLSEVYDCIDQKIDNFSSAEQINFVLDKIAANTNRTGIPEFDVKANRPSLYEAWETYYKGRQGEYSRTVKCMRSSMMKAFPDLDWEGVNPAFYEKFLAHCRDKKYTGSYANTLIAALGTVMNYGIRMKYHSNAEHKYFKRLKTDNNKVWLTPDEMRALMAAKMPNKRLERIRDLATLGYKTAARFSDYSRLSLGNIKDGFIRFRQEKTDGEVVLPCPAVVREILEKYDGKAPKVSQVQFNEGIKEACEIAGIKDVVEIVKNGEHQLVPKYKLVGSHTFRRTAARELHLSGLPLRQLMLVTGHTTLAALQRYLGIDGDTNAQMLANNPFFQ